MWQKLGIEGPSVELIYGRYNDKASQGYDNGDVVKEYKDKTISVLVWTGTVNTEKWRALTLTPCMSQFFSHDITQMFSM